MYAKEKLIPEIARKVIEKSGEAISGKEMAHKASLIYGASHRLVCLAFGISETCYRYQALLSDENAEIGDWLIWRTHNQKDWGFGLCHDYLRNVKGLNWNNVYVEFTVSWN